MDTTLRNHYHYIRKLLLIQGLGGNVYILKNKVGINMSVGEGVPACGQKEVLPPV
jgi:hypothetical protein